MTKVYINWVLAINVLAIGFLEAQRLPELSYFMNNKVIYNPASEGMGTTDVNAALVSRYQWTDFERAPRTNMFWMDYKISKYRAALGANALQEVAEPNSMTDAMLNLSYYINLSKYTKLSFGIRGGAFNAVFNTSRIDKVWDPLDPLFVGANFTLPKFGTGIQLQSRSMYISAASPDLVIYDNNNALREEDKNVFQRSRNYINIY